MTDAFMHHRPACGRLSALLSVAVAVTACDSSREPATRGASAPKEERSAERSDFWSESEARGEAQYAVVAVGTELFGRPDRAAKVGELKGGSRAIFRVAGTVDGFTELRDAGLGADTGVCGAIRPYGSLRLRVYVDSNLLRPVTIRDVGVRNDDRSGIELKKGVVVGEREADGRRRVSSDVADETSVLLNIPDSSIGSSFRAALAERADSPVEGAPAPLYGQPARVSPPQRYLVSRSLLVLGSEQIPVVAGPGASSIAVTELGSDGKGRRLVRFGECVQVTGWVIENALSDDAGAPLAKPPALRVSEQVTWVEAQSVLYWPDGAVAGFTSAKLLDIRSDGDGAGRPCFRWGRIGDEHDLRFCVDPSRAGSAGTL